MLVTSVRGIGRYRIDIGAGELCLQRSIFGVPVSRETVDTCGVREVELEWSRVRDFFHSKYSQGDVQARLVLVGAEGRRQPLTAMQHRGYTLHLRAAAELRRLLGCPARSDERAERYLPAPLPFASRIGWVWASICVGALAGLSLFVVLGLWLDRHDRQDLLNEAALTIGGGGGAVMGLVLAVYFTHPRLPR